MKPNDINSGNKNPEYYVPQHTHVSSLMQAFAYSTFASYAWHKEYTIMTGLETIMQKLASSIQEAYGPTTVMISVSLDDLRDFFEHFIAVTPEVQAWNKIGNFEGDFKFVSRFDELDEKPSFIDLGALCRNCINFIRDERRKDFIFDTKFAQEYLKEERPFGTE